MKLLISISIYFIVFKGSALLIAFIVRFGTMLGRKVRPIGARKIEENLRDNVSLILRSVAWILLQVFLFLVLPATLLSFSFNLSFLETLMRLSSIAGLTSVALFLIDTIFFYNYFDVSWAFVMPGSRESRKTVRSFGIEKANEDVKYGMEWTMYLSDRPLFLKQLGYLKE